MEASATPAHPVSVARIDFAFYAGRYSIIEQSIF